MIEIPALGVFALCALSVQMAILGLNWLYWRRRRLGGGSGHWAVSSEKYHLTPPAPLSASREGGDPVRHSERSEESQQTLTHPNPPSPDASGEGGSHSPLSHSVGEGLGVRAENSEKRQGGEVEIPRLRLGMTEEASAEGLGVRAKQKLSLLIPARNERENLPRLLESLTPQLQGKPVEVWVCDDGSDDGTTEWLEQHAPRLGVRWFRSAPRPDGWVGKNWACYQLATRAQGEWLVFLDADLVVRDGFVDALSHQLAQTDAQLVSAIPTFTPVNFWVGLVKLLVPFSVFSLLPLMLAENHPNGAFAFANGQVIGFRRADYARWLPHFFVRSAVLEDVALAGLVKSHGGKVHLYDARPYLSVSMYRDFADASQGFAKNAVAICRNVPMTLLVAGLLIWVYGYPLYALLSTEGKAYWAWLAVALSVLIFGMSARVVNLPFRWGLLYLPSIAIGLTVLMRSVWWYTRGTVVWKGRVYRVRSSG